MKTSRIYLITHRLTSIFKKTSVLSVFVSCIKSHAKCCQYLSAVFLLQTVSGVRLCMQCMKHLSSSRLIPLYSQTRCHCQHVETELPHCKNEGNSFSKERPTLKKNKCLKLACFVLFCLLSKKKTQK